MFHQMEGLVVDKGITLGDLQGALNTFVQKLFGADTRTQMCISDRWMVCGQRLSTWREHGSFPTDEGFGW